MIEVRAAVVCSECGVHWFKGDETAGCDRLDHTHLEFEMHRHRSELTLPDGTRVTAVSFDESDPYSRAEPPVFGLYFDPKWKPPWDHRLVEWPDFGVPEDMAPVLAALRSLLGRVAAGDRVEIGCIGGHGRTGTALACLVVMTGHAEAVSWVRANYCGDAIETAEQEGFVARFADEDRRGS